MHIAIMQNVRRIFLLWRASKGRDITHLHNIAEFSIRFVGALGYGEILLAEVCRDCRKRHGLLHG
jgi:hypothetical protein